MAMAEADAAADSSIGLLVLQHEQADLVALFEEARGLFDGDLSIAYFSSIYDAIERLADDVSGFDAVLVDLGLPDLDGIEGLDVIQTITGGQIPVIVIADSDGDGLEAQVIDRHAQDLLIRPELTPQGIGRAIRLTVARHRVLFAMIENQGVLERRFLEVREHE